MVGACSWRYCIPWWRTLALEYTALLIYEPPAKGPVLQKKARLDDHGGRSCQDGCLPLSTLDMHGFILNGIPFELTCILLTRLTSHLRCAGEGNGRNSCT